MTIIQGSFILKVTEIGTGEERTIENIFPLDVSVRDLKRYCRQQFVNFVEVVEVEPIEMSISDR